MFQQVQWVRVAASNDPLGVGCDMEGPSIGPVRLLKRTSAGFEPRTTQELNFVLTAAIGRPIDLSTRGHALKSVAAALENGDVARATLITQFMHLPPLQDGSAFRRAMNADALAKAGFNSDQPRDSYGRWSSTGDEDISTSAARAAEREPSGFQNTSATVCVNCHAVIPPVPPVWQGPFDDFLFGPQPMRPANPSDTVHNNNLAECHAICSQRYVDGTLPGPNRGPEANASYRVCMRECLRDRGDENF